MKLYYIKLTLSIALVSFGMASCLKDNAYEDQKIQSTRSEGTPKIVEMKIAANNSKNFVSLAYNNSNNDTVVDLVPINLATDDVAPEDINVTLELKPNLVQVYNDSNSTSYEVPSAFVTIVNPGNVVTIPKGSHTGYLQVKFKPSNLIGKDWAFGFAIASIDKAGYTISGNLSSGVVGILIKNKYDGAYSVDGTLIDLLAPGNSSTPDGPYPFKLELHTTSASSVVMWTKGNGEYHLIAGNSVYGEFSPVFNFDLATNKIISVTNFYGQPSPGRGRSASIDASGANVYNTDKSIDVKYLMRQNGTLKATFDEHFTYVGPR
jgi:hypothetical protein